MAREEKFEDLFEAADDGSILVSQEAPSVLTEAIEQARKDLSNSDEFLIRPVGAPRRALDFGVQNPKYIQTNSATIFADNYTGMKTKVLAVGVSKDGPLTRSQIEEALGALGSEANLLPEEMAKTVETAGALRSIKQAKHFITENGNSLLNSIESLKILLENTPTDEEISSHLSTVEIDLHNILSSTYTFSETVEHSLRSIDVLRTSKHYIQKYEDGVSTAMGMRHYIQHKSTLQVKWMAKYNHNKNDFEYKIGVPITEITDPDLYHPVKDAAGNTNDPLDYYYGDVDQFLIDIEKMTEDVIETTERTYVNIKENLEGERVEGSEILNQFYKIKSYEISEILKDRN